MQGSRVVVGMNRPAARRAVCKDTRRARVVYTLAVGAAHNERRFEDQLDNALASIAAIRATLVADDIDGCSAATTNS